jgi:hypothetical protein
LSIRLQIESVVGEEGCFCLEVVVDQPLVTTTSNMVSVLPEVGVSKRRQRTTTSTMPLQISSNEKKEPK